MAKCLKITKMSHLNFWILAFSTNFALLKLTCLVTLFDCKLQVFKNSPKLTILGIFHELFYSKCKPSLLRLHWDCLVTLFKSKLVVFKISPKSTIFGFFNELLSAQNVVFVFLEFRHFPSIFDLLKFICLVTLFDCKLQVFKNSPKLTIFGIFHELFYSKCKRS